MIVLIIVAAGVVIVAGGILLLVCSVHFGWTYRVAMVDCGRGRTIEVRAPWWSEIALPLEYMPRQGRHREFPNSSFFGAMSYRTQIKDLAFTALKSGEEDLIALTEAANPEVVLVLHDFQKGWTWPCDRGLSREVDRERAHDMLAHVQSNQPALRLELSEEAPGFYNVGLKRDKVSQPATPPPWEPAARSPQG